jgi:hypothetical protein
LLPTVGQRIVVGGGGDHGDVAIVFYAESSSAADVDILDNLLERRSGLDAVFSSIG